MPIIPTHTATDSAALRAFFRAHSAQSQPGGASMCRAAVCLMRRSGRSAVRKRRSIAGHAPGGQRDYAVGIGFGKGAVVSHHDDEAVARQLFHEPHNLPAADLVERARGFVGEQHLGVARHRPRHSDALILTARQPARQFAALAVQPHASQRGGRSFGGFRGAAAFYAQRELNVLRSRQVGQQIPALKNERRYRRAVGVRLFFGHCRDVEAAGDYAPRRRLVQSADEIEQRRFAAAGFAEHAHEAVPGEVQIHVFQSGCAGVIYLSGIFQFYHRYRLYCCRYAA